MLPQTLPGPVEQGFHLGLTEPRPGGDFRHPVTVPVSPQKHQPGRRGHAVQEDGDGFPQAAEVEILLQRRASHAVRQLLQYRLKAAVPALGGVVVPAVQSRVPGDAAQEGRQAAGSLGRHGVPGPQPGVAEAFFRIPAVPQYPADDLPTVGAVFLRRPLDGLLGPFPVQGNDALILHNVGSSFRKPLSPI
jgi:hypothetical protein